MIIAEIAQAHDGSLGNAHAFIDALANTGVDAVKFQTHIAEAESSAMEPFRVKFSRQDATRYDYWKRMEFSPEQWQGIADHCHEAGMKFISSPFSNAAVELLDRVGVDAIKIGSGEISNLLMLEKIAKTGKPIILSSGMSDLEELERTIDFLKTFPSPLSVLQCTTAYPTSPEQWGLNVIGVLRDKFKIPVGFSDHSGNIYSSLAAAALGAEIFEFHVVFDKRQFGPDSVASITIDQAKVLAHGIREIQRSIASPIEKSDIGKYEELKRIFGKSLAVNKDLERGDVLRFEDLESKKPGDQGISAAAYRSVLGKKVSQDLKQWDFLKPEHIDTGE
jgi:N,N'-diacetyllegionaminate synthase